MLKEFTPNFTSLFIDVWRDPEVSLVSQVSDIGKQLKRAQAQRSVADGARKQLNKAATSFLGKA